MGLDKTSTIESTTDVVTLLTPTANVEEIEMGITQEGMGHILARLTDLYTNPVEATVRELLSNGQDATVVLPVEERRPVEVTLPTPASPVFMVRDHGAGMSRDLVKTVYSKYGASTKRFDYRQVGAYGLGAKAPLAYCTQFLVETTQDGWTTTLEVTRTEAGNFVNVIGHEETGAESGTTVRIPAKLEDVSKFREAVENYRRYSFDSSLLIDGREAKSEDFVLIEPAFHLDYDEANGVEVTGRVWVRRSAIKAYVEKRLSSSSYSTLETVYALSGWGYSSPRSSFHYRQEPSIVVELKPGVVDFTSSRDQITNNERFAALDSRVQDFLTSGSIDGVLEQYRSWPKAEAQAFFNSLLWNGELDGKALRVSSDRAPIVLKPADLKTAEGFDPLGMLVSRSTPTLTTGFILRENVKDGVRYLPGKTEDAGLVLRAVRNRWATGTVTSAHGAVHALAQQPARLSLTRFMAEQDAVNAYNDRATRWPLLILTGGDEKQIKSVLSARRVLAEALPPTLVLFAPEANAELKKQVKALDSSITVEVKTVEALLKEVRELRKESRVSAPKVDETKMELVLITYGSATESETVTRARQSYRNYHRLTVSDLREKNALLVLSQEDHVSTLVGAANAGIQITGRPVYRTYRSRGVKANHLKALQDYDSIVVSRGYSYSAKVADEIREGRVYWGRRLDSEVTAVDPSVLVKSVLGYHTSSSFLAEFEAYVSAVHPDQVELLEVLKLGSDDSTNVDYNVTNFTEEEISRALPKQATELLRMRSVVTSILSRSTPEATVVYYTLNQLSSLKSEALKKAVMDEVYSIYESAINA